MVLYIDHGLIAQMNLFSHEQRAFIHIQRDLYLVPAK